MTDFELQSIEHHNALLSEEYNAHPRKTSFSESTANIMRSSHPQWKIGVRYCALSGGLVFLMNTIFLLVGESCAGFPALSSNGGKRILYSGHCDTTKNLNIGVHLLINLLSTVLLGASNYCMQCMSAPTRAEVDRSHTRFKWVDIGIPSIRNLSRIRGLRVVLWLLLGLSSLPLHLFYNSTVFTSITANEYMVFSVNEKFVDMTSENFTRHDIKENDKINVINRMFSFAKEGSLDRLSKSECLDAYAQNYQSSRGSILLVVSNKTADFTEGAVADFEMRVVPMINPDDPSPDPFSWVCGNQEAKGRSCGSRLSSVRNEIDKWQPFDKPVEYCMSERIEQRCRLEYSIHLVLIVVLIGLLKTATMLYVAFWVDDTPMLTIGDAISSFLTLPDMKTKGVCLLDKSLEKSQPSVSHTHRTESGEYDSMGWSAPPKYFYCRKRRHFAAASLQRWLTFLATFVVLIGASIYFLLYSVYWWKDGNKSEIFKQGLGAIDPRALISWSLPTSGAAGLFSNVLVANTPQILLSFLYLNYNGLMTVMSLAQEWSRYGIRRNGLRVSTAPRGAQRSTYFLQLPYRFGVPIIVITGTLHWLISQSIFLVSVEAFWMIRPPYAVLGDSNVWNTENPIYLMTCGYSPSAILASTLVTSLLLVWTAGIGFMKLPSSMPVAASCSAAIAAACHVPLEELDQNVSENKIMWGDMGADEKGIRHCGFSMREVGQPREGELYA